MIYSDCQICVSECILCFISDTLSVLIAPVWSYICQRVKVNRVSGVEWGQIKTEGAQIRSEGAIPPFVPLAGPDPESHACSVYVVDDKTECWIKSQPFLFLRCAQGHMAMILIWLSVQVWCCNRQQRMTNEFE